MGTISDNNRKEFASVLQEYVSQAIPINGVALDVPITEATLQGLSTFLNGQE